MKYFLQLCPQYAASTLPAKASVRKFHVPHEDVRDRIVTTFGDVRDFDWKKIHLRLKSPVSEA